jgi:hypothetical protein
VSVEFETSFEEAANVVIREKAAMVRLCKKYVSNLMQRRALKSRFNVERCGKTKNMMKSSVFWNVLLCSLLKVN